MQKKGHSKMICNDIPAAAMATRQITEIATIATSHLQRMVEKKRKAICKRVMEKAIEQPKMPLVMTASWLLEANQRQPGPFETCHYNYNFQAARESTSMPSGV